jgi:hypothetical protein
MVHVQGSVHHEYMPIIVQQDATIYGLFMSVNCSTCFGWRYHPKHVQQFTDINKPYIVASCWTIIDGCLWKLSLFFPYFNETWNFPTDLGKNSQWSTSRKSIQLELRWLMATDEQTDTTRPLVDFSMRTRQKQKNLNRNGGIASSRYEPDISRPVPSLN